MSTDLAASDTATADASVFAIAQAADAGQPAPASSPASEQTTPSPTAASVENASPQEPATAPGDKAAAAAKPEAKAETPYAKAQRERERQQSLLKNFDAEKAAFRQEQARVAAEQQALRNEVAQLKAGAKPAAAGPARDEHGHTAEAYEDIAQDYEDEGNSRMAELARNKAKALRAQPQPSAAGAAVPAGASQPSTEKWQSPEFQQQWQAEAAAIVQAEPALAKPDHPIFQRVNQLVNDPKYGRLFKADPTGLRAAVEVAKLEQMAGQAQPLKKSLDAAQAEVKRLTALLSPRGSLPASPAPGQKSLDHMSEPEREAHVLAAAFAADRAA